MLGIFSGCSSLSVLPDISKWDTSNIKIFKYMFCNCSSLVKIPDILKWDLSKGEIDGIFNECLSLTILPEILNNKKCKLKKSDISFSCLHSINYS